MDSEGKHYTYYFLLLLQERNSQWKQKMKLAMIFHSWTFLEGWVIKEKNVAWKKRESKDYLCLHI